MRISNSFQNQSGLEYLLTPVLTIINDNDEDVVINNRVECIDDFTVIEPDISLTKVLLNDIIFINF